MGLERADPFVSVLLLRVHLAEPEPEVEPEPEPEVEPEPEPEVEPEPEPEVEPEPEPETEPGKSHFPSMRSVYW